MSQKQDRLEKLRNGEKLSIAQLLILTIRLSIPAILAQISHIIMEYIDASMVGHLGSSESASIGLVASSTWLFHSLCTAVSIGFTVQIAHAIGAGESKKARGIVRQGLTIAVIAGSLLLLIGAAIHSILPQWLGAEVNIQRNASMYFLIFSLTLPAMQLNSISAGMLQCSGNMKIPSILQTMMCFMDIVFNALMIFPTRSVTLFGITFKMYGAGLGVAGAALGTMLAEIITALLMLYFLLIRSKELHLRKGERLVFVPAQLKKALRIAVPVGFEQVIMCGAYIAATRIVSPLGMIAIAANSFAVTTESLCYMPGYGIGSAATTLIGQSIGAKRQDVVRKLAWLTTLLGMAMMTFTGILMYIFAPQMIGLLSPDPAIRELGADVLRIEAFAEPMYAASIVASGVFRGAGDTLIPSGMNFFSMWAVRLPLSAFLAPKMGLRGVWIAMAAELCVRGIIFLIRLCGKSWQNGRNASAVE